MTEKEVLEQLESMGTSQNRSVYADHGVKGKLFGVSFGNLAKLARSIGVDQSLAERLWATKNHDARMLATMIADARAISSDTLDEWTKGLDNHILAESFSSLVARSPAARLCVRDWIKSRREVVATAAWGLVAQLARRDGELEPTHAEELLEVIEKKIAKAPDRPRAAMNSALIAIGTYIPELEQEAIDVAGRIGKMPAADGDSRPMPDAAAAIANNAQYHRKRTAPLDPEAEREYARKRVSISDPLPIRKRRPKKPKKKTAAKPKAASTTKAKAAAEPKASKEKPPSKKATAKKTASAEKSAAKKKVVKKPAAKKKAAAKKKVAKKPAAKKKAAAAKKKTAGKKTVKKPAATKKKVVKKPAAKKKAAASGGTKKVRKK